MSRIIFLLALIGCFMKSGGQSPNLKGLLLASGKLPLAGATITTPYTTTTTTADGRFSLASLQAGDTITITATGYEPLQFRYAGQAGLELVMQPLIQELEEVIMETGYQRIPAERATGSFAHINKDLFNQQVSADILSRLEAISSGFSVDRITGEQPRLQVRGISTIQGPRDPLIVVDNFPYEGDINNINPNEVASITILKDAAASSIWGARAGNGVIVITTNKPKFNKPLNIQFNQFINYTPSPDLFAIKEMSPAAHIEVEQYLFNLNYRLSDTALISRPPLTPVYEVLLNQRYGRISASEAADQLNMMGNHDIRNDLIRYFYRNAIAQQYYLSLQAGNEKTALNFSVGYDRSLSELAARNDRINLRMDHQFRLTRKLQWNNGLFLTRFKATNGRPGYGQLITTNGVLPLYSRLADNDGNPKAVIKDYRLPWLDTVGNGRLLDWQYRPLNDYQFTKQNSVNYDLLFNTMFSYQVNTWLATSVNYQFKKQDGSNKTLYDQQSYFTRNLVNAFTKLGATAANSQYPLPRGAIRDHATSVLNVHQVRSQININKSRGHHEINFISGAELRHAFTENESGRVYGLDPDILTITPVDYANAYPNFLTGTLSFIPDNTALNDALTRFASLYANAAYTYRSRYTTTFSGRRDGANMLGVLTNEKWQPLWSAGFKWNLSAEKFAPLKKLLDMQLRITYGVSGNVDLSKTGVTIISYTLNSPYTQSPQAFISRHANPELQWEQSYMLNTGLDFSLHNKRLSGSIEYYRKRGEQLFGNAPIDYTGGAGTTINKNVASMKGQGIDLAIDGVVLNKNFRWQMQWLYSWYKDKVTDYFLTSLEGHNFITLGRPRIAGLKGKPVYSIFSYEWAGLDPANGNPQGFMNGALSTDYTRLTREPLVSDLRYHGPALPVHFGSIGNSFGYKNLSVDVRLLYRLWYYYRRTSIEYSSLFTLRTGHEDFARRWQKPGDELQTNVPSLIYPLPANRDLFYGGSAALVEKGDHLRLAYITVAYKWHPQPLLANFIKEMRVYGTVSNAGIIWRANKSGLDPDNPASVLPASRSFAIGLNASFH